MQPLRVKPSPRRLPQRLGWHDLSKNNTPDLTVFTIFSPHTFPLYVSPSRLVRNRLRRELLCNPLFILLVVKLSWGALKPATEGRVKTSG
jgi:hypothetical protein